MKLPLARVAALSALAATLAACASAPDASAPDESATRTSTQALTPVPEITATQFVADFGKPASVAGTNALDCGIGEVRLFAGPMPTSFLPADGRLLQISQNAALFVGLSTTFGGDGRTTFALPNLTAVTPNNLAYGVCVFGTFIGNR